MEWFCCNRDIYGHVRKKIRHPNCVFLAHSNAMQSKLCKVAVGVTSVFLVIH